MNTTATKTAQTIDNGGRKVVDIETACGRGWGEVRETGRGFSACYGYHVHNDYSSQSRTMYGPCKMFKSEAGAMKFATNGALSML